MQKQRQGISLIVLVITIIVMLILASVTIISLVNNGIIGKARRATDKMDKAQITQMAELIKGEYLTEVASNKTFKSKQELKERFIAGFEVTKDTNGDDIIEVNDKWAVRIDADLNIEVVEITDELKANSLVALTYTTSNFEEEGKIYSTDVNFSIARTMDYDTYSSLIPIEEVTDNSEKEKIVIKYLSEEIYGAPFESIDDAVIFDIVANGYGEFTTIEECLADEWVQFDYGTTKEQLYYAFCTYEYSSGNEYTKGQLIDFWYDDYTLNIKSIEYNKKTTNLSLYVNTADAKEVLIKNNINTTDIPTIVNYIITKNGTYTFILKTSSKEEITRESITVNNLEKENPYYITEEEANGVWVTNNRGEITEYLGNKSEVIVPLMIGKEKITTVDGFINNEKITSVAIPKGITKIGVQAFYNCSELTSVIIPEGVNTIERLAFIDCKKLENITLPKSVNKIGDEAFRRCSSLKTMVIPEGVTLIGYATFSGCIKMENVVIPESVMQIGESAFYNCDMLDNVVIPKNVTSIGDSAFYHCDSLKTINISEGVTLIGGSVFNGCINLTSITLPNSLEEISSEKGYFNETHYNFTGCTNLTKIYFAPGSNPIPNEDYAPWGAPNPEVKVIKLQ